MLFPLDGLPHWAQALAWLLPLTSVLDLLRSLVLDIDVSPQAAWSLGAWTGLSIVIATGIMARRQVK